MPFVKVAKTALEVAINRLNNYCHLYENDPAFVLKDPRESVKQIVKAKFLEILPSDVPYKINPVIQTWTMDNGVLRLGLTVNFKGYTGDPHL